MGHPPQHKFKKTSAPPAVTALHLGYDVATLDVRDFQRVPGLSVVEL